MRKLFLPPLVALQLTSCATMNDSLKVGAGLGRASGAAATYAAGSSTGESPPFENVALGAGIGLGLGLLTSYLVHRSVEDEWKRRSPRGPVFPVCRGSSPLSPVSMGSV